MASTAFERIAQEPLIAAEHPAPLDDGDYERATLYVRELTSGRPALDDSDGSIMLRVAFIAHVASHIPSVSNLVVAHQDTKAQNLLNAMQEWLDVAPHHPERRNVMYLLVRLANSSSILPDQLSLAPNAVQIDRFPQCKGHFGLVYFGRGLGHTVVAKRISIKDASKVHIDMVRKEVLVWRQLSHPRLAKFLGLEHGRTYDISIITVRYEEGTLSELSSRREMHPIPSRDRNRLLRDVVEGLDYLHSNKVVHADIKPENILVETVNNQLRAVLCDFGLSLVGELSNNRFTTVVGYRGTPAWSDNVTPLSEEETWLRWKPSRDIYAFGLVALWLCTGTVMWQAPWTRDHQFLPGTPPPTRPGPELCVLSLLSDELWNLLSTCWVGHPDQRPTAGQLYEAFRINADVF